MIIEIHLQLTKVKLVSILVCFARDTKLMKMEIKFRLDNKKITKDFPYVMYLCLKASISFHEQRIIINY